MSLTITADRALDYLRPGDRIIAIDGHRLRRPHEVRAPHVKAGLNRVPAIGLVNARGTATEWNLYPGNFDVLTIERGHDEPEPHLRPRGTKVRKFGLLALVSDPTLHWATRDGQHGVRVDDGAWVVWSHDPRIVHRAGTEGHATFAAAATALSRALGLGGHR